MVPAESPRRQFLLPRQDEQFLDASGFSWETVKEGRVQRIVIRAFPVPPGYNLPEASLNLRIEPAYPDVQIDMVYFSPALARNNGKPLYAISTDAFDGKIWQRWSRHRTRNNPWRPGVDNVETHLMLVSTWLQNELER